MYFIAGAYQSSLDIFSAFMWKVIYLLSLWFVKMQIYIYVYRKEWCVREIYTADESSWSKFSSINLCLTNFIIIFSLHLTAINIFSTHAFTMHLNMLINPLINDQISAIYSSFSFHCTLIQGILRHYEQVSAVSHKIIFHRVPDSKHQTYWSRMLLLQYGVLGRCIRDRK